MKRLFVVLALLFSVSVASAQYFHSVYFRKGIGADSLRVNTLSTFITNVSFGPTIAIKDSFAGALTTDTVTISGALATDFYYAVGRGAIGDSAGVLHVQAADGYAVVHRLAADAEAGEKYFLFRAK